MSERVRWEDAPDAGEMRGYVGSYDHPVFRIWPPDENGERLLFVYLAGHQGELYRDPAEDELKAVAERLLTELASSLGAVFAESLLTPLAKRHAMIPSEWGGGYCGTCWVKGGSRAAWPCEEMLAIAALLPVSAPAPSAPGTEEG